MLPQFRDRFGQLDILLALERATCPEARAV